MRFSIIIPAYNIEKYIHRCIDSVQAQDFKDIEIIVIDDCSTDGTKKEIKKIPGIKIIEHNENKCLGAARNSGMEIAKGEYIIFLDGDDYLYNEKVLGKLDKLIGNNKPDVVYMGFQIIGNKEEMIIPTEETCTRKYKVALDQYPNVWSKCWRREFLMENNFKFPEKRFYEDVVFTYQAIMKVKDYMIADFPVHIYISGRQDSITTTLQFKNIYDTIENIKELLIIKKKEPTEEVDIRINNEISWCKKRLEKLVDNYMDVEC